jgi:hypothetical protein
MVTHKKKYLNFIYFLKTVGEVGGRTRDGSPKYHEISLGAAHDHVRLYLGFNMLLRLSWWFGVYGHALIHVILFPSQEGNSSYGREESPKSSWKKMLC